MFVCVSETKKVSDTKKDSESKGVGKRHRKRMREYPFLLESLECHNKTERHTDTDQDTDIQRDVRTEKETERY